MKKPTLNTGNGAATCYNPVKKAQKPVLKIGNGTVTCYKPKKK